MVQMPSSADEIVRFAFNLPVSPDSLPSGRGEAGSYPQPALKQGKAKHRSCLVSIDFLGVVIG